MIAGSAIHACRATWPEGFMPDIVLAAGSRPANRRGGHRAARQRGQRAAENAVDAGATRVDCPVQQGGGDWCGRGQQLWHCRATAPGQSGQPRHQQDQTAEDLFRIASLGVSGGVASIAEVSQLRLVSRSRRHDAGAARK
jgi:hypothetical protein